MSPYPILEHRALPAVPKTLFKKGRREGDDLPLRPAGSELVAVVDGEYVKLPGQLRGAEPDLVAASEVLVIDTRPSRQVVAKVELDSSVAGESFVVHVTFSCSVLDAVDVAKRVPDDIVPILENHLKSDPQLMSAGNEFAAEDVSQLREMVSARVKAWCLGRRPPAPGMRIELASIDLDTPDDLRQHAAARREELRRQSLERLKDNFSFEQAKLIEELIDRGPEALEALALRLNEDRYFEASKRAYGERDRRQDQLRRIIDLFGESGHFETLALDTPKLVDRLLNSLLPQTGTTNGEQESYTFDGRVPSSGRLGTAQAENQHEGSAEEHEPEIDPPNEEPLSD